MAEETKQRDSEIAPVGRAGKILEKVLENPTLVIAGLAAVPLLFLAWGLTRRRSRKRREEEILEDESV
jgi:hypothetical protein